MEYGLIGEKLGHSFSKIIHEKLADYTYELCPLAKDELDAFMTAKQFKAINVTIPYKQDVIPHCDVLDDSAKRIGVVNTIVNRDGKLFGYNTDFAGFLYNLNAHGITLKDKKVMICGSGGTCKTVTAVADVWRMLPKERRGAGPAALPTTTTAAARTPFFYATILESQKGAYMVKPEAGFPDSGKEAFVSVPGGSPVFQPGDRVTIYFDGTVMETYPPQVNALRIEACTVQATNPGPQVKTTGKPPASVTNPSTPGARGEMAGRLFDHLEKIGAWPKGMYERAAFTETVPVLYDGISYTVFRQHMGAHWDAQLDGKPYSEDIGGYTFTGGQMAPYSLAIYVVTRDEVLTLQEAYEQGKVDIAALHAAMYPDEKN